MTTITIINVKLFSFKQTYYIKMPFSHVLIDILVNAFLFILATIAILTLTFLKQHKLKTLLNVLFEVDEMFSKHLNVIDSNKKVLTGFVITNLGYLIIFGINIYFWGTNSPTRVVYYYSVEYFLKYHVFCVFILMINIMNAIFNRLKTINLIVSNSSNTSITKNIEIIKDLRQIFTQLCDCIDIFNDIFGLYLLIFVFYTLSSALSSSIQLIRFSNPYNVFKHRTNTSLLLTGVVLWTLVTVHIAALIIKIADDTSRESKKITSLCYKLSKKTRFYDKNDLKTELVVFAKQAYRSVTSYNTAGFFILDNSIFFKFLNMYISYLIILIQFKKNLNHLSDRN
ncbi:gustatory and pheromone receptor 39a isoform X1 [Onthophagus taurus]|uniref:gustatory and pheromone receptor 39a isoform X1 n=1 Tax=Onthophagus taurus TaxID=166361 RepID=UPI0039BE4F07